MSSDFASTPLGVTPLAMKTVGECASVIAELSEKVLLDASEFVNAVYEDMSQINEILTLKNNTLQIEGTALFFKGF